MLYHLGTESRKVILFIDILGFGDLVRRNDGFNADDGNPHSLALMFPVFYDNLVTGHFSIESQKKRGIRFLWASDTIVISSDVDNAKELIEDLIFLQNRFYSGDMAFRGAICIGNLYHQGNIWGETLVRAADIEKTKACYPRILVSKSELEQLNLPINYVQYFEPDELDDSFMSFSPFKPNISLTLAGEATIVHSMISVYAEMVTLNFNIAQNDNVKNKWRWMAKKLIETLYERESEIIERLHQEKELGYPRCDLNELITELKTIG